MPIRRTHRIVAFALSLVMTLSIFSGVGSLASHEPAGPWLVQWLSATQPRG